jgi:hypothetical protein
MCVILGCCLGLPTLLVYVTTQGAECVGLTTKVDQNVTGYAVSSMDGRVMMDYFDASEAKTRK